MANPSTLSVKITLENGKELAVTLDCDSWDDVKKRVPEHYPLLRDWADSVLE